MASDTVEEAKGFKILLPQNSQEIKTCKLFLALWLVFIISGYPCLSPLLFTGWLKTTGGRRTDLGNPPDMSKYLKKKIACGADFWMVENKGGGRLEGEGS